MAQNYDQIHESRNYIASKCDKAPEIGVILGTGLGKLVDSVSTEAVLSYEEIPHFPVSTVESHAGKLIIGKMSGKRVLVMQGRFHYYEGYSMDQIVFPIYVMKSLGISSLVVSNAAGGINPNFKAGTLMTITDHINLLGNNPLIGANDRRLGVRYPDMSQPYSKRLIDCITQVALELKIPLAHGVYASMSGPCLETRAEYRMLKTIGADAIGMSTVPEVIAAVHAGLSVLGISVITDSCLPDALEAVDISKIIAVANEAEPKLVKLIAEVLKKI